MKINIILTHFSTNDQQRNVKLKESTIEEILAKDEQSPTLLLGDSNGHGFYWTQQGKLF